MSDADGRVRQAQPTGTQDLDGRQTAGSATLAANERIRRRIESGEHVTHLAFGEAGLPVHPALAEVLASAAHRTAYPSVAGDEQARAACARHFQRRGIDVTPDRVVLAPGSKALLYGLLLALPGDVVLPRPSWVSYAAQAGLAAKPVISVPISSHAGGVPDPAEFEESLTRARAAGSRPGILVLTRPDNPTGTVAPDEDLAAVCRIAAEHDLVIISDEIYAELTHPEQAPGYPTSPATIAPDRVIVTTGLSKSLALGGWRIGAALLPATSRGRSLTADLTAIGSEVWSAMPGPMQPVASYAFDEPEDLRRYVNQARRLHGTVARAMWHIFTDAGVACREPQAGFYLYPDFEPHRDRLGAKSIATAAQLAEVLLDRHGIGVLPGDAFGDDPSRLAFRVATSLLYGRGVEERTAALNSADPLRLPWIDAQLRRVREELGKLLAP